MANATYLHSIHEELARMESEPLPRLQRSRIARALGLLGPRRNSEERIIAEIRRLRALDAQVVWAAEAGPQ